MTARLAAALVASNSARALARLVGAPRGQDGERTGRDGHREAGVDDEEHLPAIAVQDERAVRAAGVGEHDRGHRRQVLGDQGDDPNDRQSSDPGGYPVREPQRGPQPEPEPGGGHAGGEGERRHACRGAQGQGQFRSGRERTGPVLVTVAQNRKSDVRGGDHEAGQDRRERRSHEPAVRLQDAIQHDRNAVQRNLRRERDQHPRAGRHGGRVRTAARRRDQQRGERSGHQRDHHGSRHQQQHGPGQQGRRDPPGLRRGGG